MWNSAWYWSVVSGAGPSAARMVGGADGVGGAVRLLLGLPTPGGVGEQHGHLPGFGQAHPEGVHVEPATDLRNVVFQAHRFAGARHPAVGVEPEGLQVGHQLAGGFALRALGDTRLLGKHRVQLLVAEIHDVLPGVVEQDFQHAETLVHAVEQGVVLVGGALRKLRL